MSKARSKTPFAKKISRKGRNVRRKIIEGERKGLRLYLKMIGLYLLITGVIAVFAFVVHWFYRSVK